ncbi:MAG: hypothetical protein AAFR59_04435 [Bacteroidota bacterium]
MEVKKNQATNSSTFSRLYILPVAWEGQDQPPEPQIPVIIEIPLNAAVAALSAGINGMMREGGRSLEEFQNGKLNEAQFTYRIIQKGTQEAVKGGVRTAAALTLVEGVKAYVVKKWGQEALKRLMRNNFLGSMAFGLVDQTSHTLSLANGKITYRDYKVKSIENAGSVGGAIGGAAAGAMLGSVVPGLGTTFGAMVGYMFSMFGAMSGGSLGKNLGEEWFPDENKQNESASTRDIPIEGEDE